MSDIPPMIDTEGLSPAVRQQILRCHRARGEKALKAVDAGKIRKYLDFYVVTGQTGEYVVEEDFCTCSHFTYRGRCCWHILAAEIAARTGLYECRDEWYVDRLKNEKWARQTI
ncbi:SWIM zinc finger family protein [Methanofollis fontis]|uniref:SWIM-type domain-containing protein n=1 Tax=Methanofollis fontis TaxID=2052832 RepID=A0A483CRB4_9EURY|nr:SWIM zinc finger family protein [Methanofollis fontis]TAJ44731.1 hypothetical protein CUJ86_05380 [Methanofollis fontis]